MGWGAGGTQANERGKHEDWASGLAVSKGRRPRGQGIGRGGGQRGQGPGRGGGHSPACYQQESGKEKPLHPPEAG